MNPFETVNDEVNNNLLKIDMVCEIWTSERGRKIDTFISGLPYTKDELSEHLKNIKKVKGCNGSIKNMIKDDGTTCNFIHVQGNLKLYLKEYFESKGILNIKMKN